VIELKLRLPRGTTPVTQKRSTMTRQTKGLRRKALLTVAAGAAILLFAAVAPAGSSWPLRSHSGHMKWLPGAFVNGGYTFWLSADNSVPVTVQVTGTVDLPVHCGNLKGPLAPGSPISVPVSIAPFTIPAHSTAKFFTSNNNDILSWMGAVASPDLCGGGLMYNKEGATFNVVVNSSAHVGQINFRFHYKIPAADKQPNTDCTIAGNPNHDAMCGKKWSNPGSP
jgi:hypothetical protein